MIRVKVLYRGQAIQQISVSGHSGYAEAGHDIICAAVSTAFVGVINCLDDAPETYEINVESGLGSIRVNREVSQHDAVALEVMVRILGELAETYPDFIQYQEERRK